MSTGSRIHEKFNSVFSFSPGTLLQRKLGCGVLKASGEKYKERSIEKQTPQRASTNASPAHNVPPIAHEVLRSPGLPMDEATQAFFEPRFGHDFSRVRVHTDSKAVEMAKAFNALAFTVEQSIYFGAGQYRPESKEGIRLLAHELAHTVQQRSVALGVQRFPPYRLATEGERLEREADQAAKELMTGRFPCVVGTLQKAALQREDKDKKNKSQSPKIVPPVEPSKAQKKMIDEARNAAAIRTQIAMFKASGLQGAEQFYEAKRLAQIKFDWADPNMDQIAELLRGMGGGLTTVDVKVAGAGDPECGTRRGYVRGFRPPIVLCPGFFSSKKPESRIQTMIHEMAHVKGIGKADVTETYFMVFDCTSKGSFGIADSWANYVHCLSGQKPEEERVPTRKQAPKKPGGKK